jgi:hypothetical protein
MSTVTWVTCLSLQLARFGDLHISQHVVNLLTFQQTVCGPEEKGTTANDSRITREWNIVVPRDEHQNQVPAPEEGENFLVNDID